MVKTFQQLWRLSRWEDLYISFYTAEALICWSPAKETVLLKMQNFKSLYGSYLLPLVISPVLLGAIWAWSNFLLSVISRVFLFTFKTQFKFYLVHETCSDTFVWSCLSPWNLFRILKLEGNLRDHHHFWYVTQGIYYVPISNLCENSAPLGKCD